MKQQQADHELTTHLPTDTERLDLHNMKRWQPFRIVWGMIHKDTGKWSLHAHTTKAQMMKAAKAGHYVLQAQ